MVEHEANPDDFENTEKSEIENLTGKWNQTKNTLSDKEILAQSFIFYIAGYETTASTLSFLSYNRKLNTSLKLR
jgi:cytochrome P450